MTIVFEANSLAAAACPDLGWVFHQHALPIVGPSCALYINVKHGILGSKQIARLEKWVRSYRTHGRVLVIFQGEGTKEGKIMLGDVGYYPDAVIIGDVYSTSASI